MNLLRRGTATARTADEGGGASEHMFVSAAPIVLAPPPSAPRGSRSRRSGRRCQGSVGGAGKNVPAAAAAARAPGLEGSADGIVRIGPRSRLRFRLQFSGGARGRNGKAANSSVDCCPARSASERLLRVKWRRAAPYWLTHSRFLQLLHQPESRGRRGGRRCEVSGKSGSLAAFGTRPASSARSTRRDRPKRGLPPLRWSPRRPTAATRRR